MLLLLVPRTSGSFLGSFPRRNHRWIRLVLLPNLPSSSPSSLLPPPRHVLVFRLDPPSPAPISPPPRPPPQCCLDHLPQSRPVRAAGNGVRSAVAARVVQCPPRPHYSPATPRTPRRTTRLHSKPRFLARIQSLFFVPHVFVWRNRGPRGVHVEIAHVGLGKWGRFATARSAFDASSHGGSNAPKVD